MVIFMMGSFVRVKLMEKELILMPTAHTIMGIGSMTSSTDSGWNPGLMEPNTRVTT